MERSNSSAPAASDLPNVVCAQGLTGFLNSSRVASAIARAVGGAEVQAVVPDDLISRIIVQSSRHAGLSAVYSELLDFEGSEIYSCFPVREELRSLKRGDFFRHRRSHKLIDARLVLFAQPLHCLFE